jgi:hypothetical protein
MPKRFVVAWGREPDMGDHPNRWHCAACGKESPYRAAVQCGECAHAWARGWLLSLHDLRTRWRYIGPTLNDGWGTRAPWWRLDRLHTGLKLYRPSKVWVCPCCSHDL